MSALSAAKQGIVDDIIAPAQLRSTLIRAIEVVSNKREPKLQKSTASCRYKGRAMITLLGLQFTAVELVIAGGCFWPSSWPSRFW